MKPNESLRERVDRMQ